MVNDAVDALNLCSGSPGETWAEIAPDHMQTLVHIHACAHSLEHDLADLSIHEAASARLKDWLSHASERSGTTSLASYGRALCLYPTTSRSRFWYRTSPTQMPMLASRMINSKCHAL